MSVYDFYDLLAKQTILVYFVILIKTHLLRVYFLSSSIYRSHIPQVHVYVNIYVLCETIQSCQPNSLSLVTSPDAGEGLAGHNTDISLPTLQRLPPCGLK